MKGKYRPLIVCAAVTAAAYWLLPPAVRSTGTGMLVMLIALPAVTFLCAAVYSALHGFEPLLPVITAALFAPTVWIYYNSSAWVYIPAYALIALAGSGVGALFRR